jgi:glycosyltransferase involved in cell wall biosynthesis
MGAGTTEVLYLSYDGLTDQLGQSQILPYLCGLSARGFSITIVSFEKPERFATGKQEIETLCINHGLRWVPLLYHRRPPVFSTLYDLFVLRRIVKKLHRKHAFSIVHCRSYITALTGLWLKQRHGIKFIFDMRGFWADERVEGGLWNLGNPLFRRIYQFFKGRERAFISAADAVVVLTEAARAELAGWNLNDRITVIPCCVDLDLFNTSKFNDQNRRAIRTALGIDQNDFVFLYLGSLGTWYLYDEMVAFFHQFKARYPQSKFLFLTPDGERVAADPDFIVRSVKRAEVPQYIYASDASLCFIKPSFSKKGSSATKMAEVMAMGVPVVTNPGWGDVAFLGEHAGALYIAGNGDDERLLLRLAERPETGVNTFFKDFFSLQGGIERYRRLYEIIGATQG